MPCGVENMRFLTQTWRRPCTLGTFPSCRCQCFAPQGLSVAGVPSGLWRAEFLVARVVLPLMGPLPPPQAPLPLQHPALPHPPHHRDLTGSQTAFTRLSSSACDTDVCVCTVRVRIVCVVLLSCSHYTRKKVMWI